MTLTHHDYLSNPEYHNSQTYTSPGVYALPKVAYGDPACGSPTFSGSLTLDAVPGTAYEIIVGAFASADGRNAFGSVIAEAFADPLISFAPGFDPTGYSIELSAGVESGLGVPEPHGLLMLALTLLARMPARRPGR